MTDEEYRKAGYHGWGRPIAFRGPYEAHLFAEQLQAQGKCGRTCPTSFAGVVVCDRDRNHGMDPRETSHVDHRHMVHWVPSIEEMEELKERWDKLDQEEKCRD